MKIKKIVIKGFKTLENFELIDPPNFMIIAGTNGSGKSNFFKALQFVSAIIGNNLDNALKNFGRYEDIHSWNATEDARNLFEFAIEIEKEEKTYSYTLIIEKFSSQEPTLKETLYVNKEKYAIRTVPDSVCIYNEEVGKCNQYPRQVSILQLKDPVIQVVKMASLPFLYQIIPYIARSDCAQPNPGNPWLDSIGGNLVDILNQYLPNDEFKESLTEYMSLMVPSLENVLVEEVEIDKSLKLSFNEKGQSKKFPARLISDGTMNVLCLLVAVLSPFKKDGIITIEEPENGVNPKVVEQFVELFRARAKADLFIWTSTHSQTMVRCAKASELLFFNKENGRTVVKYGRDYKDILGDISLDTAWLSNVFGGGLPW